MSKSLLFKCAEFYLLASLEDELAKLDLNQEILEFFNTISNPKHKGMVFSFVKKNSSIDLQAVKSFYDNLLLDEEKKSNLKTSELSGDFKKLYDQLPSEKLKVYLVKLVKGKKLEYSNDLLDKLKVIDHFIKENDPDRNINELDFNKLYNAARVWEESFKNAEIRKEDLVLDPSRVVYRMENPEYSGFFIYELKTQDECTLEGKLLNHCVATHYPKVEDGSERIFSLRDSSNKPYVTIEASPDMFQFNQTFSYGNSEPSGVYIDMINEWKLSLFPEDNILTLANSSNVQDQIKAASFMDYNNPKYRVIIDEMIAESEDSGMSSYGSYTENKPQDVLQALAINTTLPSNLYDAIYEKCKNNLTTVLNLSRNLKISSSLLHKIYYDHDNDERYAKIVSQSMSLKHQENNDLIEEIIVKYYDNKDVLTALLNNVSISSSICTAIINNLPKEVIDSILLDDIDRYEGKFIDDLISSNNPYVKSYLMDLLVRNDNYNNKVLLKFYKLTGNVPILGNRNELVEDLIDSNNDIVRKYIGYADYDDNNLYYDSMQFKNLLSKGDADIKIYNYLDTNIHFTQQQFELLLEEGEYNENVIYYLAKNEHLTQEQFEVLFLKDSVELAKNKNLMPKQIEQLLSKNELSIDQSLARNPNLTLEQIEKLLSRRSLGSLYVIRGLSRNVNLTLEQIEKMLSMNDYEIKVNLAKNANLTSEQIEKMLQERSGIILSELAQNPSLTQEQFTNLLLRGSDIIDEGLAKNPGLTQEQFAVLLSRDTWNINVRLALNPNLTKEQFSMLLNKGNDSLNGRLSQRADLSKEQCIRLIKYAPKALLKYLNKQASKYYNLIKMSSKYYQLSTL